MNTRSMAGWIGFAGILMVILGGLTFFEGLIALLRDNYYVPTGDGFLVVDRHRLGLDHAVLGNHPGVCRSRSARRRGWARWTSILFVSVNIFGQLGFLGNTNDLLWMLITLTLNIIVLYALVVRWGDSQQDLQTR